MSTGFYFGMGGVPSVYDEYPDEQPISRALAGARGGSSMSFSDPVRIIDHIPQDFDMKRITRKRPLEQRRAAKQARQNVEPFSCERPGRVWTLISFIGALAIVAGALITGHWER